MTRYLHDLLLPLGIVAGAVVLTLVLQRYLSRLMIRWMDRKNWKIGRRLVRTLRLVLPIWVGLLALQCVLGDLPLRPSALPYFDRWISALFIFSFAIFAARVVTAFIRSNSTPVEHGLSSITLIENTVRAVVFIFAVLAVLRTFRVAVTPLLTALGVGGLAVALALQDTLSNFFAGVHIILSKQIDPGDYIKLASGEEGMIEDINWRLTTIRTTAGTLILVPNSKFVSSIITNFDRAGRDLKLVIPFTLESSADIDGFEKIAMRAAADTRQEMPHAVLSDARFDYSSITKDGTTVSIVLNISEFSQQNRIKAAVLRRIHQGLYQMAMAHDRDTAEMLKPSKKQASSHPGSAPFEARKQAIDDTPSAVDTLFGNRGHHGSESGEESDEA